MLCDNKVPRIKRQVASIHKKSDFSMKDGRFRTNTPCTENSSQKKQSSTKTGTPSPRPGTHRLQNAKIQGASGHTGQGASRDVDVRNGDQLSQEEPAAARAKDPKSSKSCNPVPSEQKTDVTDNTKDGPLRNQNASRSNAKVGPLRSQNTKSNAKDGPKRRNKSKQTSHRAYYIPSNDTKTFQINNKGHLQCHQDPNFIFKPNDKGKLQGSREAPIYHEPGTVSCKMVEDLKKLYPNSFDRLGSLKGEYNICVDPKVKPVTHARWKVPIE